MTAVDSSDIQSPTDKASGLSTRPDWHLLRNTILESVSTSPDAFLARADRLEKEPPEYWEGELRSSAWAVAQDGDKIVGIAAAKRPRGTDEEYADPAKACFIESVWIAPSMRRNRVGERLVTYLIEERRKDRIQQFFLWVFDHNAPAIGLYDHMDFKPTGRFADLPVPQVREVQQSAALPVPQVREVQYVLAFDSDVVDDDELARNAGERQADLDDHGITYRLLKFTDSYESSVGPLEAGGSIPR